MYELEFRRYLGFGCHDEFLNCDSLVLLPWTCFVFKDLALDPHESSCFGQRSQRLIQLIVSIMIEYFVVHFETLVKFFGLMF